MMSLTRAAVWLVVLLSSAYAVEVRQLDASQGDEVLRDLSESDVIAPKTPAGAQKYPVLKESLGSNPNCPPSAFPICMNGGKVNERPVHAIVPGIGQTKNATPATPKDV